MYVCALRPRGESLSKADVFGYITRLKRDGASLHSIVEGPFAAVAAERPGQHRKMLGRFGGLIGAGDVRLDNRSEVAGLAGVSAQAHTDLELVLAAIDRRGEGVIPRLLGDFAFVCWDARAQKLLAVRDAFGVRPLYRRAAPGLQLFSSDIEPLRIDESYDFEYIADFLSGQTAGLEATVWRGITPIAAGSLVRQRGTVQSPERYWRAEEFVPAEDGDEEENCQRFRSLLEESVQSRVEGAEETWAHLSGGLDSSSIVALSNAAGVEDRRIVNTITIVDTLGEGDERAYSDTVVQRYDLRNEQVRDYWAWQDDGEAPPMTDQPSPLYPFHARDRRAWNTVRQAGGRVLLSGFGADQYLHGNLDYITDLAAKGRIRDAVGEVTAWSVAMRQSFWSVGRRYLLDPFLSRSGQRVERPHWLAPSFAGCTGTGSRMAGSHRFARQITANLNALPAWLERWPYGHEIEMRYPFLYRPLVEASLRLPATQRVRPNARKWILRQATRDVLPEQVRMRSTKGGIDARILWSLHREKPRLDAMLRDPILAQLGCIDAGALRRAVDEARRGIAVNNVQLFSALALETWLSVRNGVHTGAAELTVSAA
ncbi:MAG TPA: asparagine synthase-related protein [Longimicrobiales bacterium]|nr:asparagine synthase-related protein [Longimicrobiales bacterium]